MFKAIIRVEGHEADLIGVHEFIAIPPLGTSVSVMDRNANMHYLTVTEVLFRGLDPESEVAEIQKTIRNDVHLVIFGRHNSELSQELRS